MDELERIKKEKMKKLLEKAKAKLIIDVNDNNFEEKVIKQSENIPVVADFWSQRCPPCLMLGPILEKLAKEYNKKFILAKVNVDEAPLASQKYGIMSIPNVKLFKGGRVVDEFIGAMPEPVVKRWLDANLR